MVKYGRSSESCVPYYDIFTKTTIFDHSIFDAKVHASLISTPFTIINKGTEGEKKRLAFFLARTRGREFSLKDLSK